MSSNIYLKRVDTRPMSTDPTWDLVIPGLTQRSINKTNEVLEKIKNTNTFIIQWSGKTLEEYKKAMSIGRYAVLALYRRLGEAIVKEIDSRTEEFSNRLFAVGSGGGIALYMAKAYGAGQLFLQCPDIIDAYHQQSMKIRIGWDPTDSTFMYQKNNIPWISSWFSQGARLDYTSSGDSFQAEVLKKWMLSYI